MVAVGPLSERCAQENLCPSECPTGIGTAMLPVHGLIKLKLRHRFRLFRFAAIRLIKIRFHPIRRCASRRDSRRCGRFTGMEQDSLNRIRLGEEGNDL